MHEEFATLHADTRDRLIDLAFRWGEGELSAVTFAEEMDAVLLDAHTQAVVIGRSHAGDTAPEDRDDRRFAAEILDTESLYLQGFAQQMAAGSYTDETGVRDAERVAMRASLYAGRLTGTANQAWTLALDEDTLITWVLGGTEDHCSACPDLAENSPYLPVELRQYPGDNSTPCRFNCLCTLQAEGGQRGFAILG